MRPSRLAPASADVHCDAPEAIVVADSTGRVTHCSTGAPALWGYAPEDAIGIPLADLVTADATAVRHRDGRALDTRVRLFPLGSVEQPAGFVLVAGGAPESGEEAGNGALVKWAFDQHPTAFVLYDHEARIQRLNTAMSRIMGYGEDEMRGRFLAEIVPGSVYEEIERRIRRVLRTGRAEYTEPFVRTPGEPKAHAWFMDIFPLKNAAGRVRGVAVSASDFSQQYDFRERLALLSEARTRIGSSLDVEGIAQELAEVVVPRFADVVSVDLLESVFQGGAPGPVPSGPVLLRRAAHRTAFARDAQVQGPDALHRYPRSSPVAQCLVDGRSVQHAVTDQEIVRWLADDPVHAEQIRAGGVHSLIAVPVRAHGATLGAVVFGRRATSLEPFGPECLAITEDLVGRVAICLDNARQFTRDRGIALTLQRSLLPRGPTVHPAAETAARYLPAGGEVQAGGDWYDVIPLPDNHVALVIGDVQGHSAGAATLMGQMRTALRAYAAEGHPPDVVVSHANRLLLDMETDLFATCAYVDVDMEGGTAWCVRAGHLPPVLRYPDGSVEIAEVEGGPPLGVLAQADFPMNPLRLQPGTVLALTTDGLVESPTSDIDQGMACLADRLAAADPGHLGLVADGLLTDAGRNDDIALLLMRYEGLAVRPLRETWTVWRVPEAVSHARRFTRRTLRAWEVTADADAALLVVSELVTNALVHTDGQVRLDLTLVNDRLRIAVADTSPRTPVKPTRIGWEATGGRGILLVEAVSAAWGTLPVSGGKQVWSELVLGE
ncbi:SpoIIE family protein phosphatase [Streptomyces spiralis]